MAGSWPAMQYSRCRDRRLLRGLRRRGPSVPSVAGSRQQCRSIHIVDVEPIADSAPDHSGSFMVAPIAAERACIAASGVSAGAITNWLGVAAKSGTVSLIAGISGKSATRSAEVTPKMIRFSSAALSHGGIQADHAERHFARHDGRDRRAAALEGDLLELEIGHVLQDLDRQMLNGGNAGGGVEILSGTGTHQIHELLHVACASVGVRDQSQRGTGQMGDRHEAFERIVADIAMHDRGVQRARLAEIDCVAVRTSARCMRGGNSAASAGPVFHHDLLSEFLGCPFTDDAGDGVHPAARRETDDHGHGLRWDSQTEHVRWQAEGAARSALRAIYALGFLHEFK